MNFNNANFWLRLIFFTHFKFFFTMFVLFSNRKIKDLNNIDIKGKDKLFILGTGSSINDLDKKEFESLKSKNSLSIGLNGWVYHDFVPDIYSLEFKNSSEAEVMINTAINKGSYSQDNAPSILLKLGHNQKNFKKYNFSDCKNVYVYSHLRLDDSSIYNYHNSLHTLIKLLFLIPKKISRNFLLGSGSSLERMISFGILFEFKEIVLLGFDLSGPYFYDNKTDESKNERHKTNDRNLRKLILEDMMKQYKKIAAGYNVKIFVQSKSSPLSKIFPIYKSN